MAENIPPPSSAPAESLTQAEMVSRAAWRRLFSRVKSVTPSTLARTILVFSILGLIGWLLWSTWPAMLPFAFGAIIAYVVLPIVNWLDKIFPRVIAILLTLGGVIALIGWFLSMLLPILGAQITRVYVSLPPLEEVEDFITDLADYVDTLPVPAQVLIDDFLLKLNDRMQESIEVYATQLANLGLANLINLFNTVGFILGFLVVPGWLLTVLKDREDGLTAVNRLVPSFMRKDFWAVTQLIDRPFRSFLHGQLLMGLATAVAMYLILAFLEYLGLWQFEYKLIAALLAGFFGLIPEVGPIFAVITFLVLGSLDSFERAMIFVVVYLAANFIVHWVITPRIEKTYLNIHPAILVIAIVLLSEFGFLWILIAAPVLAIARDLAQYIYGRLDDPPRPAGVLPHEPIPVLTATKPRRRRFGRRSNQVPLAYRHGRAERQRRRTR